jgi:hypothetical protein
VTKGKFSSSDADDASAKLDADNSKKLASLPNRSEWNSKDESATLAALRQGAVPVAAPVQEAAPAPLAAVADSSDDAADSSAYSAEADSAQLASTVAESEEEETSAEDAEYDVTNRFGNTDEYIRWAAYGMAGVAVVTGVIGVLEHQKYSDAKKAYDNTKAAIVKTNAEIEAACEEKFGVGTAAATSCSDAGKYYAAQPQEYTDGSKPSNPLYILNNWLNTNKKTMDSYNSSRIMWLSLSAASIAGSVVLYTW